MIKILIIIGALRVGGAEKITVDLIDNMNRDGLDISFLVFGESVGTYEDYVNGINCSVIHTLTMPRLHYIRYYSELKRIWHQYGPFDVVHTHTLLNNGINCMWAKRMGTKRIISHSHNTFSNRKSTVFVRIYESIMKCMIKKYATDYLACGKDAGEYLYGKNLFSSKGEIIYNGVSYDKFCFNKNERTRVRDLLGIEDGEICIGHAARLEKVKNHTFVIDIIRILKDRNIKAKYLVIGEGTEKERLLQKTKELGLADSVIFLGNRNDVYQMQNAFDLVLYPSFYEGMPVALIESQINQIPCIVSDNVTKEVRLADKTKFLSLEKDAKVWANAVIEYIHVTREDNPLLPNARFFNIKESAEKLKNIYLGRNE